MRKQLKIRTAEYDRMASLGVFDLEWLFADLPD